MVTYGIRPNGKFEACLSETSNWDLFNLIAKTIEQKFGVRWIIKLDGLDQRYWDFEINSNILTLHLEHYLGISLFPANNISGEVTIEALIKTIGDYLDLTILHGRDL